MGIFTIYDILTGNPGAIHNLTGENKKIYGWNEKVRVVLKDGSVSKIGHYEYNGDVVYKDTKKSVFDLFTKEHRITVIDDVIYDYYDADGFLLNNKVYNLKPGDLKTIKPGVVHEFSSKTGTIIEELSTTSMVKDSFYKDSTINKNKKRKSFITL